MGSKHSTKDQLRHDMRVVLAHLERRWIDAASQRITCHLLELDALYKESGLRSILGWSATFPGEVELSGYIGNQKGKGTVFLPSIDRGSEPQFIEVTSGRALGDQDFPALILIPGLAFDMKGRRLGRGKGWYDRFLQRSASSGSVVVGVCFSSQIVPEVPTEKHDRKVDLLCTELALYSVQE